MRFEVNGTDIDHVIESGWILLRLLDKATGRRALERMRP